MKTLPQKPVSNHFFLSIVHLVEYSLRFSFIVFLYFEIHPNRLEADLHLSGNRISSNEFHFPLMYATTYYYSAETMKNGRYLLSMCITESDLRYVHTINDLETYSHWKLWHKIPFHESDALKKGWKSEVDERQKGKTNSENSNCCKNGIHRLFWRLFNIVMYFKSMNTLTETNIMTNLEKMEFLIMLIR